MSIKPIKDIKLNVRPVSVVLYHDYVFEGPCRFGEGPQLTYDFDKTVNLMMCKAFEESLTDASVFDPKKINFLPHILIERNEEFIVKDEDMEKVGEDIENVDAFYIHVGMSRTYDFMIEMAERFNKPIILGPTMAIDTITTAAIAATGRKVYPARTVQDVARHFDVLRVKKMMNNLAVLCAARLNSNRSFPSAPDGFLSTEDVTKRMGIRFRYTDPHEILDSTVPRPVQTAYDEETTNHTTPGRIGLNPDDEDMAVIEKITDEFIAGAAEVEMDRELIMRSVKAWYVVNKFMDHLDCNAFTIPCPDVCATRRLNKEKITFCLTHSLNQEIGIPSACEYDIPALVTQAILMGFSGKAPYMGNCEFGNIPQGDDPGAFWSAMFVHEASKNEDIPFLQKQQAEKGGDYVIVTHAVPNRKFKGFDAENAPYAIRSFARSGFGATIRYDFKQDIGQVVTLMRIDPLCRKFFIAKGEVIGGIGYKDTNCSEGVVVKIKDHADFFKKQSYFGNHVPLVYGDYVEELKALAEEFDMEVVEA